MSIFNRGKRYATGIEIGTSKICVVIAEVSKENTASKEHSFKILGIGQSPSHGVRKGAICKPEDTKLEIRDAVAEAERSADVTIGDVCVGITGSHVRNANSQGEHLVEAEDRVVSQEDKIDVLKNAEECRPKDVKSGYLLHRLRQPYLLDGVPVDNPVGKMGETLTLPIHWVYGMRNMVGRPVSILNDMSLEPKYPIFNGYAASLAMDMEQRYRGGLVIDLGAGTTEYVFMQRGHVLHAGVLPIGGDHVSNDLALGLKLGIGDAEILKISRGRAISDPQAKGAMLPFESKSVGRQSVRFDHFQLIMELRLKEIFQIILTILTEANLRLTPDQRVMLCGGGACIQMIDKLAESIFQVKTVPYKFRESFQGMYDSIKKPQFATPIGLAYYCACKMASEKGGSLAKILIPKVFSGRGKSDE